MYKIILTEEDIEKIAASGTKVILVEDNMVLTDLAYEKAEQLGIKVIQADQQSSSHADIPNVIPLPNHNILQFNHFSPEQQLRDAIILTGQILYQSGLMVSNDGNISVRMPNGDILITPSGVTKGRITAEDLLVIDPAGRIIKTAENPNLKVSSEQPMHLEIYHQRPDVWAVIHTHLVYANALAISKGVIRMDVIPEAAMIFGEIPITDFALPSSTQNADAIRNLIKDHDVMIICQ